MNTIQINSKMGYKDTKNTRSEASIFLCIIEYYKGNV